MSLTNQQYDKIQREYDQVRFHNKHILDGRFDEIYHNIPDIKCIDDQIATLSIKQARQSLLDIDHSLSSFKDQITHLSNSRVDLLVKHGYPKNYLEPIYSCNECKDTGYVNDKPCHCFKQAIVDILYDQSNIRHLLENNNFNHFNYAYYSNEYKDPNIGLTPRENIEKVVKSCYNFMNQFDMGYANLFIYGNTGVGKTFLTHCIAKELLDRCKTVIYLTSFQFFNILEKTQFRKNYENCEYEELLPYLLDCELLVIDDLGTELVNSFTSSRLFYYINERHMLRKSTIISTNLSLDELNSQYTERVFSRIVSNYTLFKLFGDDIRLKKIK